MSSPRDPEALRRADVLAGLLLLGAVALFLREAWPWHAHHDDAYIAYRYAQNLAAGRGLVWNVGEHVEGFTSLLYVLLLAAGMKLGLYAPMASHALGLASGVATLLLTHVLAGAGVARSRQWVAALAPWLLASTTAFAYWTTSGMETPLFCAVVLATLVLLVREREVAAAVAGTFAMLTRPDGVLVLGLSVAVAARRRGVRNPTTVIAACIAGVSVVALTMFRLRYYGYPVPNTFYAKVGSIPAWVTVGYLLQLGLELVLPVLYPAAVGAALVPRLRLPALYVGVTAVYVAGVGADAFGHARFLLPAAGPLLACAVGGASAAWGDARLSRRLAVLSLPGAALWYGLGPPAGAAALAIAVVVALVLPRRVASLPELLATAAAGLAAAGGTLLAYPTPPGASGCPTCGVAGGGFFFFRSAELARLWEYNDKAARLAFSTCDRLASLAPPVRLLAAGGLGVLGYCSDAKVIDLLGLTDSVIAHTPPEARDGSLLPIPGHQRSNASYVLRRRPDLILIPQRGSKALVLPAVADLWADPELDRSYRWNASIAAYERRSRK